MRKMIVVIGLILLSACGARGSLQLPPEKTPPSVTESSAATPSAADLLKTTPDTRPQRVDEVLRRSEKREDDPFDLPPQT
jgi:predicted small lipoprotein YifL